MRAVDTADTNKILIPSLFPNMPRQLRARVLGGLVLVAIVLGAGVSLAPDMATYLLVAIGIGLPTLLLMWAHPELGLLALLFATSSFIPPQAVDLRLPVGGLDLRDLTLLAVSVVVAVRLFPGPREKPAWGLVGITLVVLLSIAFFSAIYAVAYRQVEANWVFSELRPLTYFGTFFLTTLAIARKRQLAILLGGLYVLADLTAAVLIVQQFFGKDNRLLSAMTGGTWNVWSAADPSIGFGAVRIIPPGHVLTYVVTILTFCMLMRKSSLTLRLALLLQFVYLNFALLFTYSRAQWIASAIAIIVTAILLPKTEKISLARFAAVIAVILMMGYGLFGAEGESTLKDSPFFNTVAARASSVLTPAETIDSYSLQWRVFETEQALRSISQYPLLGVGLGAAYRAPTLLAGEAIWGFRTGLRLTRYVHNSYLYLAVKMGLPGLLAMVAFAFAVLLKSWQTYKTLRDRSLKLVTLAMLAGLCGFLMWSGTESHLLLPESTSVVGLVAGIVVTIGAMEKAGTEPRGSGIPNSEANQ